MQNGHQWRINSDEEDDVVEIVSNDILLNGTEVCITEDGDIRLFFVL